MILKLKNGVCCLRAQREQCLLPKHVGLELDFYNKGRCESRGQLLSEGNDNGKGDHMATQQSHPNGYIHQGKWRKGKNHCLWLPQMGHVVLCRNRRFYKMSCK